MEEKKRLIGSLKTGSDAKNGAKGLIFSNRKNAEGQPSEKKPGYSAAAGCLQDPIEGRTVVLSAEKPIEPIEERTVVLSTKNPVESTEERAVMLTEEKPTEGRFGVYKPKAAERKDADSEPRDAAGGGSKFGYIGVPERRTSKIVYSNRRNKPVISSAFFLAINGNGETRVIPVLNGMLIGRVWANSTVPDIPLSTDADRRQGVIYLQDGRIWLRNNSERCRIFLNGLQPETDRFELRFGDIVRIHSTFDLTRANDTILILFDRIPEGLTWDQIRIDVNGGETVQLVREDGTAQAVAFSGDRGRIAVTGLSGCRSYTVNNRPGGLNRVLNLMDVVNIDGTYFICIANGIVCQTLWKRKTDSAKQQPPAASGGLKIAIRERTVRKGLVRREALLRDIRLFIPKGSLVLILGGSGAGKTTFINAVMGYEPAEGTIRYDDIDVYREYEKMKYAIGYVQQEDLLRRTDVVSATLEDAAKMHLACSKEERDVAVAETMKLLGLEREKDKLVGQLSGGQRKRLSIGVEYVGEPLLFFLDEPDSGLDGSNADNMWDIVRKIADTGKIVMVISHIPDRAFDLFDRVVVLAKDKQNCGRLAFTGTPEDACAFFKTERLEEIVKRVNRVNEGGEGRADEFINRFAEAGYGRV